MTRITKPNSVSLRTTRGHHRCELSSPAENLPSIRTMKQFVDTYSLYWVALGGILFVDPSLVELRETSRKMCIDTQNTLTLLSYLSNKCNHL